MQIIDIDKKITHINTAITNQSVGDQQFYNNLQNYTPLFFNGQGTPIFMINNNWYHSLGFIIVLNAIFGLIIAMLWKEKQEGIPSGIYERKQIMMIFANIGVLGLFNLSYLLTQFLNPGIKNLSTISQNQYEEYGDFYCYKCNGDRTGIMEHCKDCGVCVQNKDHHCGFFGKCIAGKQTYAFYTFLFSVLLCFIVMMVTLGSKSIE